MGLGLVLVAIGWLYRRILFRRQAAPPSDGAVLRTNLDVDRRRLPPSIPHFAISPSART
jgi:hypothetical protein